MKFKRIPSIRSYLKANDFFFLIAYSRYSQLPKCNSPSFLILSEVSFSIVLTAHSQLWSKNGKLKWKILEINSYVLNCVPF